jgi:large repetitive protein
LAEGCTDGEVIILLGNGDGTFQPPQSYDSGAFKATSVAVGDFNGDGHIDLAVTHVTANGTQSSPVVSILLGKGDGTLQTARTYAAGHGMATNVTVADVNHDGKPDLVIAVSSPFLGNSSSGQMSVVLGRGNGGFQPPRSYASGGIDASSVAVGDFNGDGNLEVVVANRCLAGPDCLNTPNNGALSVLLQRGGRFLAPPEYASPDCDAHAVAVGDFNGDGNPDLAVANSCFLAGGSLSIFIGKPNGTFQTGQSFSIAGFYALSSSGAARS